MTMLFYVPGDPHAIDYARESEGRLVSMIAGQTLAELAERYPGVVLADEETFLEQHDRLLSTDPREIAETQFFDALGVLPPINWRRYPEGCESFMWSEFIGGNVTTIFARRDDRYWSFQGVATLTHADIMKRIWEADTAGERTRKAAGR